MLGAYLVLGALTGMMSGLLGIGGGIIIVPVLADIFFHYTIIPHDISMHLAIGTSLAIMVVSATSAMYAHHQRSAVLWPLVFKMMPALAGGAILGAIIARFLPSEYLKIFFSLFLFFVGTKIFFSKVSISQQQKFSPRVFTSIASVIGILSSILGIGGGALMVPFLLRCGLDMRQATGTSVACGVSVAIVATLSFMLTGLFSAMHIPWTTGYIYWPAFFGVSLAGLLFAPVGAMLAHKLPTHLLKRVFAVFLLIMAVDMFP